MYGFFPRRKEVTRMDFFDLLRYASDVATIGMFVFVVIDRFKRKK